MKEKPLEVSLNTVASANQTGFFVNLNKMRPVAIPEKLKQIYTQSQSI